MIWSGTGGSRRRDRGAAAVELALVMPLLLLVLCGIIDFGRMYNTQITLTQAAREGARAAAYGQDPAARVSLAGRDLPEAVSVTASTTCPNSDGYAEVTIEYDFAFVTPFAVFAGMFGATPAGTYDLESTAVVTCSG
ncbi:MAG: pilus assembly protein [Dactylosporangium sp.]|nr:pilus assembly protein [Dactylosporangium sp.]NNJ63856.1 pilus assembly protein [Dactylosporangium sp.]